MAQEFADFEVEYDFNQTEAWSGEQRPAVPVGDYLVTVAEIEQKTGNGKPMISVTFEIAEGEHTGSKVWNNYMLGTKPGLSRLKSLMVACGASLDKFKASECLGAQILISVSHTQGDAKIDAQGNSTPGKTFVNAYNERALETTSKAEPAPPPVLAGKTTKPTNGTARRA